MSPDEDEETGVTYLEDGTPVRVIYITDEMHAYLDMTPEEAQALLEAQHQAWVARSREIIRKGRHD